MTKNNDSSDPLGWCLILAWFITISTAFVYSSLAGGARPQQPQLPPPTPTPTPIPRIKQPISAQFIAVARQQIGVREQPLGSNRGPEVDEYNRTAGAPLGSPWCASVQHWTGVQIGLKLPNAYSPSWFPRARQIPAHQVRPGDFAGVFHSSLNRIAHIAVVERVDGNRVITLEGNTNAEGSREGHGYFRRSRLINSLTFSRWLDS